MISRTRNNLVRRQEVSVHAQACTQSGQENSASNSIAVASTHAFLVGSGQMQSFQVKGVNNAICSAFTYTKATHCNSGFASQFHWRRVKRQRLTQAPERWVAMNALTPAVQAQTRLSVVALEAELATASNGCPWVRLSLQQTNEHRRTAFTACLLSSRVSSHSAQLRGSAVSTRPARSLPGGIRGDACA